VRLSDCQGSSADHVSGVAKYLHGVCAETLNLSTCLSRLGVSEKNNAGWNDISEYDRL
jgi:hypothetical protein